MRWILPSVLLVFSSLACGIGTPTPPAPIVEVVTVEVTAPPTEQPPTPVSLTTAPPPPPPSATPAPTPTVQSPPPPTPTPTIPGLILYEPFDGEKLNEELWTYISEGPTTAEQNDGFLMLSRETEGTGDFIYGPLKIEEISFVEAKVKLESNAASDGGIDIVFSINDWAWATSCAIVSGQQMSDVWANCWTQDGFEGNGVKTQYNSWHTVRIEVNPATGVFSYLIDGQPIGTYTLSDPEAFKQAQVQVALEVRTDDGGLITGYIDDVRVGKAGQP